MVNNVCSHDIVVMTFDCSFCLISWYLYFLLQKRKQRVCVVEFKYRRVKLTVFIPLKHTYKIISTFLFYHCHKCKKFAFQHLVIQ